MALNAQTIQVKATNLVGGDGQTTIGNGQITWLPTDSNGNPQYANLGTTPGLMIPRPTVCLISNGAITTNLAGGTCTLVQVSTSSRSTSAISRPSVTR